MMNREYTIGTANNITMFIGTEVEHSPAFGKKTLFVVGRNHNGTDIMEVYRRNSCEHLFIGANQSFHPTDEDDWRNWDRFVQYFLDQKILVTVDMDVKYVEDMLESGWTEKNNFIPMISVKLPYINLLGYNATVKIDDKDFNATNPGVWCHQLHDLMDRAKLTTWDKYTSDMPIQKDDRL